MSGRELSLLILLPVLVVGDPGTLPTPTLSVSLSVEGHDLWDWSRPTVEKNVDKNDEFLKAHFFLFLSSFSK